MSSVQTTLSCDQKRKASSCGLSVREIILLIYSCGISFLFFSKSVCDCSLSQKRVLISDTRITNNDYNSSDTDWVQQHIIGRNNFPPSSVEFPLIFKHGFTYDERKMCRGHNKTKCNSTLFKHSKQADTLHGDRLIYSPYELGKHPISVDPICQGFNYMFEFSAAFTYPNFLGVSLQQDPNDAFAIMDLIWRLKPDLLIELGTNGGGSAFFYAFIMRAYNPQAKVVTIDPMRTKDWNLDAVKRVCPHCIDARDTALWTDTDAITFIHKYPAETVPIVQALIQKWGSKTVMVMEDSNHKTKSVTDNLNSFAPFVTPGSYFIVQDTKMRRLMHSKKVDPLLAAERFLASQAGSDFEVDRSFEYYHCSQHAQGFLRRKKQKPAKKLL